MEFKIRQFTKMLLNDYRTRHLTCWEAVPDQARMERIGKSVIVRDTMFPALPSEIRYIFRCVFFSLASLIYLCFPRFRDWFSARNATPNSHCWSFTCKVAIAYLMELEIIWNWYTSDADALWNRYKTPIHIGQLLHQRCISKVISKVLRDKPFQHQNYTIIWFNYNTWILFFFNFPAENPLL